MPEMRASLPRTDVHSSVPLTATAGYDPVEERGLAAKPKLTNHCAHRLALTLNRAFIMWRSMGQRWTSNNARGVNKRQTEGEPATLDLARSSSTVSQVFRPANLF